MSTGMLVALGLASWWACGVAGFIYWWTHEMDFKADDVPLAAFVGILGLGAWVLGWLLHGEPELSMPRILIKRRTPHER